MNSYFGMTIALKSDFNKVIIEFPLESEKNFLILNFMLLNEHGKCFYSRKVYEIVREKKLKLLLSQ
jgi:hypothetical protein